MLLAPTFLGEKIYQGGKTWLIFPDLKVCISYVKMGIFRVPIKLHLLTKYHVSDLKECEIAKEEWAGQRYREATFTTIEAVTNYVATGINGGEGVDGYDAPWGSSLMSGISKMMGGDDGDAGLLGDKAALDPIIDGKNSPATLWLVIQPGNGGPVEDWVNCEKMSNAQPDTPVVIINGALDKVKGGFYPAFVFPKLAATVDRFYKKFDAGFYLKPYSDKGLYGWLYRVYPEPWLVVYENVKPGKIEGNPGKYLMKQSLLVSCQRAYYILCYV